MLLSYSSISHISNILTGNSGISPYKGQNFILDFMNKNISDLQSFEEYCTQNTYADEEVGLQAYIVENLKQIRGTSILTNFVEAVFSNIKLFTDEEVLPKEIYSIEEAVASFNNHMLETTEDNHPRDPYSLKLINRKYKVVSIDDLLVDFRHIKESDELENYHQINQFSERCLKRLHTMDYSGVITLSRSMLEKLSREIIVKQGKTFRDGDDINSLVNKALKAINFDVSLMSNDLKAVYGNITKGCSNFSLGLGTMRNCMSDSHSGPCVATEKDAVLSINVSRTLSSFLLKRYLEVREVQHD